MRTPKLTFANAIALIALFASLGGTVYAAAKIDGKTIRKASIPADRFKPDGLTGAQIDEGTLDTVPRADRVAQVNNVPRAGFVPQVPEADEADVADTAVRAQAADRASFAPTASRADTADTAVNAETLGGQAPGAYVGDCEGRGAVKGYVLFDPQRAGAPKRSEFNCSGRQVQVTKDGDCACYTVTFPGANGTGSNGADMGVTTAFGLHSLSGVDFDATSRTFRVFLDSSEEIGRDLSNERWSLVVF
ncbi:MAG TPA: hypothetical protein VMS60_05025 [Solirubrobacterales bacterium]|nr:hypothetical protein [Solirubrobacterales bacterium]